MDLFRESLRHHPDKEQILDRLENDNMPFAEFAIYLREAEQFSESWMKEKFRNDRAS